MLDVILLGVALVTSAALVWVVWADARWHQARARRADRDMARLVAELDSCQCAACRAGRERAGVEHDR